jgi:hypothetical protein
MLIVYRTTALFLLAHSTHLVRLSVRVRTVSLEKANANSSILFPSLLPAQITGDFAELFEGGFKIFDDFLSENIARHDFLSVQSFQRLNGLNVWNGLNGDSSRTSGAGKDRPTSLIDLGFCAEECTVPTRRIEL